VTRKDTTPPPKPRNERPYFPALSRFTNTALRLMREMELADKAAFLDELQQLREYLQRGYAAHTAEIRTAAAELSAVEGQARLRLIRPVPPRPVDDDDDEETPS
jgi:hypothetical protein